MSKHGKILVAMSGGIDSSVVAIMLKEQGYDVIGLTMKTWDYETSGINAKETGCCSLDSINDAKSLAVKHQFPHYILDIRQEFNDAVINNFVSEYLEGRTPNPCVLCNTYIKWEALLKRADLLDCGFIATGHYANIKQHTNKRFLISKGKDPDKDQSYVLWGISQENLARTLFPLGNFTKTDIKAMALEMGHEELVAKKESYEICFVPDNDYRAFLKHRVTHLEESIGQGNFVLNNGKIVGKHKGYPFYTIGQRKGLEIALGEPMFVTKIIPETNTVVLGKINELQTHEAFVRNFNLMKYDNIHQPIQALVKVRYKDKGQLAQLVEQNNLIKLNFEHAVSSVAPGQSAVFYEGDDLIGGGFLC